MYAKIFATLWDGTLADHWEAWTVWVFMLANCGPDGILDVTPSAIARRSGLPPDIVARGLEVLAADDPDSRSPAERGRRIVLLDPARPWGWRLVNYHAYRGVMDAESLREQQRGRKQRQRQRERDKSRSVTDGPGFSREVEGEGEVDAEAETLLTAGADPSGSVFEKLPTNRPGVEFPVTREEVAELQRLYPAVNAEQEVRGMRGWLMAHKHRRKTWNGMRAFMNRWMATAQDRGGARPSGARSGSDGRYETANTPGGLDVG